MPMLAKIALPALALLAATPAQADWHEASSDHFVVYADAPAQDLTRFAANLERYHAALALVTGQANSVPSPSNRVTVYVVGSPAQVRKLYGDKPQARFIGGFYVPRAGRTMAIVPDISTAKSTDADRTLQTLLHEYAHHFLISTSNFPIPLWANEGAAEFFSSAGFEKDGQVTIGRPNPGRLNQLAKMQALPVDQLVDPGTRSLGDTPFYAQSWLLYHYLVMGGPRKGQLTRYYDALVKGQQPVQAARGTFGDLAALGKELGAYARRPKFTTIVIKGEALTTGRPALRALPAGEAAAMPLRIRQHRGLGKDELAAAATEARTLATRYPQDAAVQTVLAEAEFDAGSDAAAIAAADAALALDRRQVNAWVQKGYAQFRLAGKSGAAQDFKAARATFVELNHLENDHPLPLVYYFRSFVAQRQAPSALAVQGLERAAALAPYDLVLRMNLAGQQLREGRLAEARYNLTPVAYAPHSGRMGAAARAILAKMDSDPNFRGIGGPAVPSIDERPPED